MINVKESILGLSGGFILIGALSFIIDFGSNEMLMFGLFSLTGALLLLAGLLMKNQVGVKNVHNLVYLIMGAGIVIFLTSALIDWHPMELLILVTCEAYGVIVYTLLLRNHGQNDQQ